MSEKPKIPYWHLWADEKGISHHARCSLDDFDLKPIQPGTAPQWQGQKSTATMTTLMTVLPVGWVGTWHENPRPQWIIPLTGRWFVEAMDGSCAEMGPGELAFGGDQNCTEIDGKRGHRSGTVGDEPTVLMVIQFEDSAAPAPCALRRRMDGFDIVDPRFAHYLLGNARLETLAEGFRWIEGLVWMGDADCLLFQDLPRNRTMRWIESAGTSVYRAPSGHANGQARDKEGRLIACSHLERCLFRTELDGSITRLVDRHAGKRLNAPNDVVVKSDGTIWFTDPLYGIQNDYEGLRQTSEQPPALYRFDPASGEIRVAAGDFDGPNGLVFSPDESKLYVAETGNQTGDHPKQFIRVFEVAADGRLSGGAIFHKIAPGYADGLAMDEDANLWSSADDGVHCIDPSDALMGTIFVPYRVSNLTFGGLRKNRLFIGGSQTLYAIFLNRRGAGWP